MRPATSAPSARRSRSSRLVGLGITPNRVSYAGLICAFAGGACLALGAGHVLPLEAGSISAPASASWWPLIAAVFIAASSAADVLDGRLARGAGMQTRFGAVLDSTLDRFGDMAIFIGCAVYFGARGNATWVALACVGLVATVQISYVKARAENLVEGLGVGFWQRGERMATILCGAVAGRMPAALWIMAVFPLFTVLRRILEARRKLERVQPRRHLSLGPRGTLSHALLSLAIALAVWLAPWIHPFFYGMTDPLGDLLR
jgi:CDP-diacylglycerol--glycerol-3-phosphate 3-phosphatidyltransferase